MSFLHNSLKNASFWALVFWFCTIASVYAYAGYPVLLWVVTRLKRQQLLPPSTRPQLTLLITAHNEGAQLGRKIRESLALNYPKEKLQILVVSDGSTDGTIDVTRSFFNEGVELLILPQQGGKTNAQNTAIQHATGEIVVFSDATTEYHPEALQYIAGAFEDKKVGAVSGRYSYLDIKASSPVGEGARAYADYDNWLREMQSAAGSLTGCCGCIYAIRRALYIPLAPHIISDLVEPLQVLLQGLKVKFEPRALAREDASRETSKEFTMRVRVIARAWTGLSSVKRLFVPWRYPWIALQLISHKLLRYAIPVLLLGIFLSSWMLREMPLYGMVFAAEIMFYGAALLAAILPVLRKKRLFLLPMYFCVVNTAALWGTVQFLRGERYVSWKPQREPPHVA